MGRWEKKQLGGRERKMQHMMNGCEAAGRSTVQNLEQDQVHRGTTRTRGPTVNYHDGECVSPSIKQEDGCSAAGVHVTKNLRNADMKQPLFFTSTQTHSYNDPHLRKKELRIPLW